MRENLFNHKDESANSIIDYLGGTSEMPAKTKNQSTANLQQYRMANERSNPHLHKQLLLRQHSRLQNGAKSVGRDNRRNKSHNMQQDLKDCGPIYDYSTNDVKTKKKLVKNYLSEFQGMSR